MATDLRQRVHDAAVQATQDVFENEILPAAKAGSPVLTGKNRESISVSFRAADTQSGPWSTDLSKGRFISAWLSTHSGYGWLIEHGTSHNRALTRMAKKRRKGVTPANDRTPPRPYLYPAVMRFVRNIASRAREILEAGSSS